MKLASEQLSAFSADLNSDGRAGDGRTLFNIRGIVAKHQTGCIVVIIRDMNDERDWGQMTFTIAVSGLEGQVQRTELFVVQAVQLPGGIASRNGDLTLVVDTEPAAKYAFVLCSNLKTVTIKPLILVAP